MINPFMDLLGGTQNPAMQGFNQMAGLVRASQHPQETINQMVQSNPQMQQVMQYVQQNGGDARAAFFALARQKGVDPNAIIQQVRGMIK